ncbi:hypothetical protein COW20_11595 [bacterium (Candidatus Blackallbacteria) CG13_big_fil_rev_8_21_14_2_50_49_14]|nr:MAG: hypothetical protein COW20_11595 [bacterium (Candidatus Blackallbacteria) CG13_big_fil_rev_8_21_14_2_50_49_14]
MIQDKQLLDEFHALPPDKQAEVIDFIGYLRSKTLRSTNQQASRGSYGSLKGTFQMAEDFNEPLEDFRDYME